MVNCAVEGQSQEKLWWSSDTDVQNVCYIWVFGLKTNRTIWWLTPSAFSLRITETEQLYQAKRMIGGIRNMLFSTDSQNLKMCKIQGLLWVNLRIT